MAATPRILAGIILLAAAAAAPCHGAGNDLRGAAAQSRAKYVADLDMLARQCQSSDLTAEAQQTRRLIVPGDPYKLYIPILPEKAGQIAGPPRAKPAPAGERSNEEPGQDGNLSHGEWSAQLGKLRRDQATAMFDLARRAIRSGQAGLAFDLALAASTSRPRL